VTPSANAILAPLLALSLFATTGARAALWVSADGNDHNPGTEEEPLRTLERARDIVRTQNRDMTDDITVFIGGTHRITRPLELGPEDSGSNGFAIVYTCAPGEHPSISGGVQVTGWTLSDRDRNLWSAPAPPGLADSRDLFVNGAPTARTRGRLPQGEPDNSYADSFATQAPKAPSRNPADVAFVGAEPDAIWSERSGTPPLFVENAFELLGTPGEWYFDRSARRIYYVPRAREDMATADVEVAAAGALVEATGSRERPVTGIVFKGIRFDYTTGIVRHGAAVSSGPPDPAAIRFAFAGDVQFLEDEFVHLGTPALALGPAVEGGVIEGCLFGDIAWSALSISDSSGVQIRDSRFSYIATEHFAEGAVDIARSAHIGIEHSQIDHFPSAWIRATGNPSGAVQATMNRIAAPMVGREAPKPFAEGTGIPPDYRSLLDETISPQTVPHPPTHVSAEAEDEFAFVTWDPPCLDGGLPVSAYTVTSSSGIAIVESAEDFRDKGYVKIGGLEDGLDVSFSVAATGGTGASAPSLRSAPVIPAFKRRLRPPQPPSAVSIVVTGGEARIQVTPPARNGGSPVIAYVLSSLPSGKEIVLEGRDILHADASHPVVRTIPGGALDPRAAVAVSARTAAGDGIPLVVRPQ
jgi:hypothetical protein